MHPSQSCTVETYIFQKVSNKNFDNIQEHYPLGRTLCPHQFVVRQACSVRGAAGCSVRSIKKTGPTHDLQRGRIHINVRLPCSCPLKTWDIHSSLKFFSFVYERVLKRERQPIIEYYTIQKVFIIVNFIYDIDSNRFELQRTQVRI